MPRSLTQRDLVGIAVAENKDVFVNVLSSTSSLENGHFTGETAIIRKVNKFPSSKHVCGIQTDIGP